MSLKHHTGSDDGQLPANANFSLFSRASSVCRSCECADAAIETGSFDLDDISFDMTELLINGYFEM
jgi:hypothetical protein